jgi:hypothetical protein
MRDRSDAYHSYMQRLWRTHCNGKWQWRASLESPHTGERQLFASLGQLFTFLRERCESEVLGNADGPAT